MHIEDYIKQAKDKENVSVGGSPCYDFGNVVLIKYETNVKYGPARKSAEEVALLANEANKKGVRTPKHLGVKREVVGDRDICWVLQEKAPGVPFTEYARLAPEQQIAKQKELLAAPNIHFDALVLDLCELCDKGTELKPKNIFYDKDPKNGGFTIIDLLGRNGTEEPFDNSLKAVLWVNRLSHSVFYSTQIYSGIEEQQKVSADLLKALKLKLFLSFERMIPDFEKHRRWVLRTFSEDELKYFSENGVDVGDLTLNDAEIAEFDRMVNMVAEQSIEKIKNGTHLYWQIQMNEIRNDLAAWGLGCAWAYHPDNKINRKDYESSWEFENACSNELEQKIMERFNQRLEELAKEEAENNPNVAKAYQDYKKRTNSRTL